MLEDQWSEIFNVLKEFHETNGHAQVTKSNCADKSLVQWVVRQRQHCEIEERRKFLDSIDFFCTPLNFQEEVLERKFLENVNELNEFHVSNGHDKLTKSSCTNKLLVKWAKDQRHFCDIEKIIKLLNSIIII